MTKPTRLRIGIDGRELQGRSTGTGRVLRSILRQWSLRPDAEFLVYGRGGEPHGIDVPGFTPRPLPPARGPGVLFSERVLAKAAAADGVDVFFAPAYECPLSLRKPTLTIVHDLAFFSCPEDFRFSEAVRRRIMVSQSIQASHSIVACSAFAAREIAARFPDCASRIVRVSWGADEDLATAPDRAQARRRLAVEGPLLITVGSVFGRRRLPDLIRAMGLVARDLPGVVLDVVGDNRTHPLLDLGGFLDRTGLAASVRLSGFVDEAGLADRYAAADAAVFLSEYEGFGLPPLEAAARGVPLVTSDRPSLSEVFGDAALLVPPRDPEAISGALLRVLRDPTLRTDLIHRGRALARSLSWRQTASDIFAALVRAALS